MALPYCLGLRIQVAEIHGWCAVPVLTRVLFEVAHAPPQHGQRGAHTEEHAGDKVGQEVRPDDHGERHADQAETWRHSEPPDAACLMPGLALAIPLHMDEYGETSGQMKDCTNLFP